MNKLGVLLKTPLRQWRIEVEGFLDRLYLELFPTSAEKCLLTLPAAMEQELNTPWDGILWGVPKKRTSYTKKRLRNAHKYLKPRCDFVVCPKCRNLKLLHVLCEHCLKQTLKKTASIRQKEIMAKILAVAKNKDQKLV